MKKQRRLFRKQRLAAFLVLTVTGSVCCCVGFRHSVNTTLTIESEGDFTEEIVRSDGRGLYGGGAESLH